MQAEDAGEDHRQPVVLFHRAFDGSRVVVQFAADLGLRKASADGVTTKLLGRAKMSGCAYENADGSQLCIDSDYFGKQRKRINPFPGPFEINQESTLEFNVWPVGL
jgi:hypothetical protein